MQLVQCWQGSFDSTMESANANNPLNWTPTAGRNYVAIVQASLSTTDGDYTAGMTYVICDENGDPQPSPPSPPSPNPDGFSLGKIKSSAGGPSSLPMVYLGFNCPSTWTGPAYVTLATDGHNPDPGGGDFVSIAVVELDQAIPI